MTQNSKSNNNKNGTTEFLVHYSTLSIFSMTKKLLQMSGLDVLYTFSIFSSLLSIMYFLMGCLVLQRYKEKFKYI